MKKLFCSIVTLIIVLTAVRQFVQARYCPSTSMAPTVDVGDRFLTERWSIYGNDVKRGDVVLFYPPKEEVPDIDTLSVPSFLGDLTGLPVFPNRTVFIKRVIGIAGDRIEIKPSGGVYVNQKRLEEPYLEPATYSMLTLGDIGGRVATGENYCPYPNSTEPVVVPNGALFLLGDNRNNSQDSHVHGFIKRDRLVSKAWLKITPEGLKPIE